MALADTLLRLAERELYRPLWSARIIAEATAAVTRIHPEIRPEVIEARFAAIGGAFEDGSVQGLEAFARMVTLPDTHDRHVVAAALAGRADAIVTANLDDYPEDVLRSLNIEVIHPDDFLLNQLDLAPRIVLGVLREQADCTRQPPLTPMDLIAQLARCGVPNFADEAGRLI